MIARFVSLLFSASLAVVATSVIADDQHLLHSFSRQQLSDVYYSEGISVGDLNNDSHKDVVYGPHWYAGPDFTKKQELYPAVPQPRERYADNFFNWVHDFDGDGWQDVLVVGFPRDAGIRIPQSACRESHGALGKASGRGFSQQRSAAVCGFHGRRQT